MEQSLWKADCHSAGKRIPCFLYNKKIHICFHKNSPLNSILNEPSPQQHLMFQTNINTVVPSMFRSSNSLFPSGLLTKSMNFETLSYLIKLHDGDGTCVVLLGSPHSSDHKQVDHPCSYLLADKCSSNNSEPLRASTNWQEAGQPMEKFNFPLKEPRPMLLAIIIDNAQLSHPAWH
jgi:hypothetical protein